MVNLRLFQDEHSLRSEPSKGQYSEKLRRLDLNGELREKILPLCRLKYGGIWEDEVRGHRIGVLDATKLEDLRKIVDVKTELIISDPPYNIAVGNANTTSLFMIDLQNYLRFSEQWVKNAIALMGRDATFYIWIGADYKNEFQPLADLIILMRQFRELKARNLITLRNQRGYGTQRNWMWVRQEVLHYVKGSPFFNVNAEYTDIPKILRGYYKSVNGRLTENLERSKSNCIRAGNVWVDIQQVFYRVEENVPGCYAQKPLKAIERLVSASSKENDLVVDFFAHSGTTLIAGERLNRKIYTFDIDPIFAEITRRRLEHYRMTGKAGWQWNNPFPEIDKEIGTYIWT